jgi:hypothetical protein
MEGYSGYLSLCHAQAQLITGSTDVPHRIVDEARRTGRYQPSPSYKTPQTQQRSPILLSSHAALPTCFRCGLACPCTPTIVRLASTHHDLLPTFSPILTVPALSQLRAVPALLWSLYLPV